MTLDGLHVTGWALLVPLRFRWRGGVHDVVPDKPRADVARRLGQGGNTGFAVTLPREARGLCAEVATPSGRWRRVAVPHPDAPPSAAHRRMIRAFLRDLCRAAPALLRHAIRPEAASKTAVKRALGLDGVPPVPLLDPRWFGIGGMEQHKVPFTLVIPVHDAFDLLKEALDRVARHTAGDWRVIVIDDASTDPRVRPWLLDWVTVQEGRARLIALDRNIGFVGAVNLGLEAAEGCPGPVVLLNSDALVPQGWAPRLLAPLSDPRVASVTPMSNDAEIFGAPLPGVPVSLLPGAADAADRVARALACPGELPSAPTGVGFCMALSRRWLARVPRLDPAFGRGYGEEVDWCRRTTALGARHVCQPALFVEHRGGQSFGAEKAARVRAANAMIARRHPGHDAEVQAFFAADPLRTPRMALAVALAGAIARGPLPLYLAHALGGGAEDALDTEIARDLDRVGAALVLRVGGARRFRLEVHLPQGQIAGDTGRDRDIRALLAPVPRLRIVYSCGVGDPDPVALPRLLLSLRRPGRGDRLAARLHDYFPLSPSYCLLGSNGRFGGPVSTGDADPVHAARRPDGSPVSLAAWRAAWGAFLAECDEITVFSQASAALCAAAYPSHAERIALRPHAVTGAPGRVTPPADATGAIGILGNLNAQKGADVVAALAERLRRAGDPRPVVVIGNCDAACPMPASVRLHGGYRRDEIAALARRYGIGSWIVPSVWPETFSFTTHEALATGLPVLAFDIGGQGEAVAAAPNGRQVPYVPEADLAARLHAALPPPTGRETAPLPGSPHPVPAPLT
ncbi:glycosyltransferase [Roseibacterium sp. SDUM158016]|nr:glycosyltransferase [Roseibacterium sp. SDUM158016]